MLQDIAECDNALELVLFVYDNEAVDPRFADCVVNGGHIVVEGAGEDAWEVLWNVSDVSRGV